MPRSPAAGKGSSLAVLGAVNWDVIFEDRFAMPGEEVPVRLVEEFPGGKGANVAVAAARILGRGKVSFVGAMGDDETLGTQMSGLRGEGVLTDGVVVLKGMRSGRAYVVVDSEGRKTIHTHFGANERMTPRHLREDGPSRAVRRSKMVVVMDVPLAAGAEAVRLARSRGARVVYSPGVRSREGIGSLRRVFSLSKWVVMDLPELLSTTGRRDERAGLAAFALAFPRATVVVTLGPKGCAVVKSGVMTYVRGVDLAALGKKAVNSTGSGDAFLGAFASSLLSGESSVRSAAWGSLAGALKATRYETRGSPSKAELAEAMKRVGGVESLLH